MPSIFSHRLATLGWLAAIWLITPPSLTVNAAPALRRPAHVAALPVAVADNAITPNNTPVTFDLLGNDTDADGNATINAATIDLVPGTAGIQTSVTIAGQGTFTTVGAPAGSVTFTPVNNTFTGQVSASYTVQDNTAGTSNVAAIRVNVGPRTLDDAATTSYTAPVAVNVTTNDIDTNGKNVATVDLDPATAGQQTTFAFVAGGATVGTFTAAASGVVTYTPAAGATYTGLASVSYVFYDNLPVTPALSSVGTFTVTLTNAAPVAGANFYALPYGQALAAGAATNLLGNDTDANGAATLNAASVDLNPALAGQQTIFDYVAAGVTQGTFSVDALGQLAYVPAGGSTFTNVATVQYTVADEVGAVSNAALVSVNIGPRATDDAATFAYNGTSVTVNVTTNDTDANGLRANTVDLDPTTPAVRDITFDYVVGGVTVGTFSASGTVSIQYTPAVGSTYTGPASVPYLVYDNHPTLSTYSNPATLTVTLTNTAPVAVSNLFATPHNTPLTASAATNVVANDTDANGNATIDASTVDLDPATPALDQTNVPALTGPGTFSVNALGQLSYVPAAAGFTDIATIQYTVQDAAGALSNATTISVNVGPLGVDDAATTTYNLAVTTNVTANDVDAQGIRSNTIDLDPTTLATRETSVPFVVGGVTVGTFAVNGTSSIRYTPAAGATYTGVASIDYIVYDNQAPFATASAASSPATFSVTLGNTAPVAVSNTIGTPQATAVTFSVTANDTDVNGNTTINAATVDLDPATPALDDTFTVAGEGTFTTVGAPAGSVTFTPVAGFTGAAAATYTVQDAVGATSNAAALTANVGPVATDDAATTGYTTLVTANVTGNDLDEQGIRSNTIDLDPTTPGVRNTSVPFVVGGVTVGTFTVNGTSSIRYTPAAGATYTGTASIDYLVYDNFLPVAGSSYSNGATFTVTLTNTAPVAVNDANGTVPNTPVTFSLTANDTDVNGAATIAGSTLDLDPSTPALDDTFVTANGTFTTAGAPVGAVTFTPAPGFSGTATATYTVQDQLGATSNAATISVGIAGPPFNCNSVFYRVSMVGPTSLLERLDRTSTMASSLTYTSSTLYDTQVSLNALFLNYADGYLYAFGLGSNRLYRLSTTGVQDLGPVAGLPTGFNSATADLNGNAYIANNSSTTLYRLTIATRAVTVLTLSQAVNFGDMGFNPADGNIYASRYYPGGIYRIDLQTAGAIRPVTVLGTPANSGQDVGSIFFDAAGLMYAATNQGTLAAYNTQSGATANIGTASAASQSDGASCVFPVEEIDVVQSAATPVRVSATAYDVTFTTRVKNTGAVVDPNVQLNTFLTGSANSTFPSAASVTLVSGPTITGAGAATLTANPAFTGQGANTTLLDGTGTLGALVTAVVTYTVRVEYASAAAVPVTTQYNQVYVSTAASGPNTGYVFIGGVAVPPSQVLSGEPSTNGTTLPVTPRGDTPSLTPILFTQPLALDDDYLTPFNTPLTMAVTANDSPGNTGAALVPTTLDLNPANAAQQTTRTVAGGTFALVTAGPQAGQVTFTPTATFTGTATVDYTVEDTNGALTNLATITVHVGPRALDDQAATPYTTAVTVGITANDVDTDGLNPASVDLDPATPGVQTLATFVVGGVTVGTFATAAAGAVTYTPAAGATYTGVATATYTVLDVFGAPSLPATISVNLGPIALDDAATTAYNASVTTTVTANDTDANGLYLTSLDLDPTTPGRQTIVAYVVGGVTVGNFFASNTGAITYTPVNGATYLGPASVNYTLSDDLTGNRAPSNVATYTVTLTNAAPVAVNDSRTTRVNTAVVFSLTANDTDADGTIVVGSVDLNPAPPGQQTTRVVAGEGTFAVDLGGNILFTPATDYTGSSSLTYTVVDNLGQQSNAATVTVHVGPLTADDAATSLNGQPVVLAVTANDTDLDGFALSSLDLDPATPGVQTSFSVAGQGTFVTDPAGNVTFTPVANFVGPVTPISYVVADVFGAPSDPAFIRITVAPYADVVTTLSGDTYAPGGTPVTYTVTTVNNGPSTAPNVVVRVQLPSYLTLMDRTPFMVAGASYDPDLGVLTYPAVPLLDGQTVTSTFTFRMPQAGYASGTASATAAAPTDPNAANNNGSLAAANVVTTGPLPVTLVRFEARATGRTVELTWATASEKNSAYFDVERSADGRTFAPIGRVTAAGTTTQYHEYALTDLRPLAGRGYYRLRQVDHDGQTTYSDIRTVRFDGAPTLASVYPNPTAASATLDLTAAAAGTYAVEVLDLSGRRVLETQHLAAGLPHMLPVAALPTGAYVISVVNEQTHARQTLRLVRD